MLIYEIPYKREKVPNSFIDFSHFINLINEPKKKICLFITYFVREERYYKPDFIHIIFAEKYLNHFYPLLELYEAKKLNKLPAADGAVLLAGNEKLLKKQ